MFEPVHRGMALVGLLDREWAIPWTPFPLRECRDRSVARANSSGHTREGSRPSSRSRDAGHTTICTLDGEDAITIVTVAVVAAAASRSPRDPLGRNSTLDACDCGSRARSEKNAENPTHFGPVSGGNGPCRPSGGSDRRNRQSKMAKANLPEEPVACLRRTASQNDLDQLQCAVARDENERLGRLVLHHRPTGKKLHRAERRCCLWISVLTHGARRWLGELIGSCTYDLTLACMTGRQELGRLVSAHPHAVEVHQSNGSYLTEAEAPGCADLA